ncbi:MAG: hypothetical protein ACRD4O_08345, partial [Bryobacteraceae bacterium]
MTDQARPENASDDPNRQVLALREMIKRAFPAIVYEGMITSVDYQWEPDLDEEQMLYEALKGKDWTQVPA